MTTVNANSDFSIDDITIFCDACYKGDIKKLNIM